MGANTILGICGSHLFTKPESYIFNWYPLLFMIITFAIITPLTLYKLFKILNGKRMMNESQEIYNKELIHLSIRLVLYTSLLCASCVCFMYIIGELLFNREMWNRIAEEYVFCLVFETYLTDQGFNGDLSKCILDENNELPISIYFMQGTVVLLASSASFVLSCSNARLNQWKKVETKIALKMKSVSSIGSRENSRNNMTENTSNGSKSSKIRGIDIYLPSPRMKQVKSKSFTDTNDMIDTSKSGLSGQQRKQSIIGSHQGIITATSTPDINHDLIKEQSPSPPPLQLNLTKTKSNEEIEMGKV